MVKNAIIDTHIHIWDLEKAKYDWLANDTSILNKTYKIEEVLPLMKEVNVKQGVLVQAANTLEDTQLMLKAAAKHEEIAGVVAWLPLLNPDKTNELLQNKFLNETYFKGVRHLIHNEPTTTWLLQSSVLESLQLLAHYNVPYDVVGINDGHLETVIKIAEKIPNLRMVLDHLNQPPIEAKEKFGRWGELMKVISEHENVYAKISGLGTASGNFTNWLSDDIKEYVAFALSAFGATRCFCGGDWPVSLLAGSYHKLWENYKTVLSSLLPPNEQQLVLSKNAQTFYNL